MALGHTIARDLPRASWRPWKGTRRPIDSRIQLDISAGGGVMPRKPASKPRRRARAVVREIHCRAPEQSNFASASDLRLKACMGVVDRGLYGPFLAQLVVTRRCNLSCGYCNEFDEVSEPVASDVLKQRIDKLKELGTFSLEFTGGEPMLHPEINALIAYARSRSFHKVMMISNAYLLNEKKVKALNEAGLMELQVSVDGVLPNDVTVKVLKPMLPKLRMLARTAKFPVVLSAVLGATTPGEALKVVEAAQEFGFRPRVLVLHDGTGQMQLDDAGQAAFARVKEMLGGRRFREAHDYRERILKGGRAPFKCRAGSRYLYVDEFGDVNWCSQTRGVFKKPLLEYAKSDLKTQFYTKKTCSDACTIGCVRTQSAYDEWRTQPLDFDGPRRLPLAQG